MGSSKKRKEKKEKKKHKKRSRSREREGRKRSHKSSHRKEKHRSPGAISPEINFELIKEKKRRHLEEASSHQDYPEYSPFEGNTLSITAHFREPSPEDDFDIDQLLESKLSEKVEIPISKPPPKKRIREGVLEELRKRQKLYNREEVPDPQFTYEQVPGPSVSSVVFSHTSPLKSPELMQEIPFLGDISVKQEPVDEVTFLHDSFEEPRESLSISETNKLRLKLGLKPLDIGKEIPDPPAPLPGQIKNTNEVQAKFGLKSLKKEERPEPPEPQLSLSISDTNRLRAKLGLKPLEIEREVIPEPSEPQLSLSISDTNKLRAKLGLKPLNVGEDVPGIAEENGEKEPAKPAEVFVKTENISEVKRSEALREKLKVHKEKRAIEEKLRKVKTVAESDSEEESAADWVLKHQKLLEEKERAEKRAKMLEEMDAEFGVGALVEEEFGKSKAYTSQHLKGLTIGHQVDAFQEGTPVILTLKDKGVLDEEEDILENVNIVDNEKYSKNIENKKKKPGYQAYEEPEFDEFGILKKKNLLSKYDEEIEGEKKKTFKIGTDVTRPSYSTREQELELIRMKLKQQNKISLEMPELKVVNEYYTPDDMVQFKKPKKKKKIRKLKADDLLLRADDLIQDSFEEEGKDFGSRKRRRIVDDVPYSTDTHQLEVPEFEFTEDLEGVVVEEDQAEKELYSALNKAKKLKQRKIHSSAPEKVIEILGKTNASGSESMDDSKATNIELNSVAEFCRTLGDIPTYGMSGNREDGTDDMMDLERELMEEKQRQELEAQNRGAWNEVDIDERPADISTRENEPILEEEPDINLGVAGALKLAMKKGYLDKDGKKPANAPKASLLQAQSYTIEEKFYEDDKFGKRDRYTGPTQEFREKNNYKPDVKLEYIDDSGRLLTAKEAFRYLSHKFHGKGPGKNKVDKRMKKLDQDTRLKQMSSTDTPLNTVKLLQAKQKETQSPYIVLSGGNKTLTQTMISKTKL